MVLVTLVLEAANNKSQLTNPEPLIQSPYHPHDNPNSEVASNFLLREGFEVSSGEKLMGKGVILERSDNLRRSAVKGLAFGRYAKLE